MTDLKYIDLDIFRFLTGHGKEFAIAVDAALADGDRQTEGMVTKYIDAATNSSGIGKLEYWKSGSLQVHFMPGFAAPYPPEYIVFDDPHFEHARAIGVERYSEDGKFPEDKFGLHLVLWLGVQRTITFVPLVSVTKNRSRNKVSPYQVYLHEFITDRDGSKISGMPSKYIGVTRRGWRERWQEHVRSAKNGSHYKFHEVIREMADSQTIAHYIIGCFQTETEAMALEEKMVGYESLYPIGLNMIPGGYAGMRYLHKIGAISKGEKVSPDQKHEIINRVFETSSRKGLPNPFAVANWQDPDYAEKVICGGPDRLKPGQIREARYLETLGKPPEEIASDIGARNVAQVQRLLDGDTYSRVS